MTDQRPPIFNELDQVRIVRLRRTQRDIDGTPSVVRQPEIGDEGTVVALLQKTSNEPSYYVECVDDQGMTLWLAEFASDELTSVQ